MQGRGSVRKRAQGTAHAARSCARMQPPLRVLPRPAAATPGLLLLPCQGAGGAGPRARARGAERQRRARVQQQHLLAKRAPPATTRPPAGLYAAPGAAWTSHAAPVARAAAPSPAWRAAAAAGELQAEPARVPRLTQAPALHVWGPTLGSTLSGCYGVASTRPGKARRAAVSHAWRACCVCLCLSGCLLQLWADRRNRLIGRPCRASGRQQDPAERRFLCRRAPFGAPPCTRPGH